MRARRSALRPRRIDDGVLLRLCVVALALGGAILAALAEYEFHGRALLTFGVLLGSWVTLLAILVGSWLLQVVNRLQARVKP